MTVCAGWDLLGILVVVGIVGVVTGVVGGGGWMWLMDGEEPRGLEREIRRWGELVEGGAAEAEQERGGGRYVAARDLHKADRMQHGSMGVRVHQT